MFNNHHSNILLIGLFIIIGLFNIGDVTGSTLNKRDSYDCKGSSSCGLLQVKYCDHAVNYLIRNDDVNYGSAGSGKFNSGNCWSNINGDGCGVFVQGKDNNGNPCVSSGNALWYDYQDIRKAGGCSKCGSKHHDNGCLTTINYVTGCDNRE